MTQATKTPFLLIFLLWGAGLGAAGQFAKISVIFPSLQEIYPNSGASLGFLVSLISFLGIGFGLFAGLILANVSFRKILLSALLLGAVISALQSLIPSLPLMLFSRLIEGISHLIIVVAAPTLIAQLSAPQHRNSCMIIWSTFFGVAFAITAWLGIPLAEKYGPSSLFTAHSIYMAMIAVLLAFTLPKTPASPTKLALGFNNILALHLKIYSSPQQAAPALGWLFYTLTFVSLLTVLPDFVSEEDRTLISGILPLSGLIMSITLGMLLLRYFAAINVVMIGFACALATVLLIAILPSSPWLLVALVATLGLVQGASFASIPQLNPNATDQAHANGAMAQMGNLGNTLGTPIALVVLAGFGFNGLLVFLGFCYACGLLLHILQARRRA